MISSTPMPSRMTSPPIRKGNAWVSERAGKLGRFDPNTLEFAEFDTPPGPAAKDRQSLGNPQIDSKGILWVADGPNNRWLSYDTNNGKFLAFAWTGEKAPPAATAWRCIPTARSGRPAPEGGAPARSRTTVQFKFYEAPAAKHHKNPGAYGIAVAGDGSVWFAEDEVDLMARVDPATGKVEEFKIPYETGTPIRAA